MAMPDEATILATVEVPTHELIEAIGFLFYLSSVVSILNSRQGTPLNSYFDGAGCRLFRAAFGRAAAEVAESGAVSHPELNERVEKIRALKAQLEETPAEPAEPAEPAAG